MAVGDDLALARPSTSEEDGRKPDGGAVLTEEDGVDQAPEREDVIHLLLVEDNPDDAFLIRDMLSEAAGRGELGRFEISHATDLAAAREVLGNGAAVRLVLLDLSLPDSDGLATFDRLRAAAPGTAVVVLSGLEDERVALDAVRRGAQDYLVKGTVDADVLARAVRYSLERSRYSDQLRTSHERFRKTLEESDEPTLILDRQGAVTFLNPAARAELGERAAGVERGAFELDGAGAQRLALRGEGEEPFELRARVTDTVWEGQLAYMAALRRPITAAGAEEVEEGSSDEEAPVPPVSISEATAAAGAASRFEGLRTASPAMRELFKTCERVAPTSASVLLLGETGTGKELLARAIHKRSHRTGRFVAVNCGAFPEGLVESELFGHEKGAFTGATAAKDGLFRHADGGTILLDEVGNLDPPAQLALLRTLQERTVRPVGGNREIPVDVRVLAATSIPLFDAVRDGRFREDLLYRLDVIRIEVLPLRERPEDILHLFQLFAEELGERYGVELPELGQGFLEAMLAYAWPGNVRQLENFTERLLLTGAAKCFTARDFHDFMRPYRPRQASAPSGEPERAPEEVDITLSLAEFLETKELVYLKALLADRQGRIQAAAEKAGINRRTLLRKLKKYKLHKEDFK